MEETKVNTLSELKTKYDSILKLKSEGNTFFKEGEFSLAIEFYDKVKDKICESEKIIKEDLPDLGENNEELNTLKFNLRKENVNVHSNLSLCYLKNNLYEQSAEQDLKIVTSLDTKFDKSYARLVQTYTKLGKLDNAVYYYIVLNKQFTEETFNKYTSTFDTLKADYPKFAENLIKLTTPTPTPAAAQKSSKFSYYAVLLVLGLAYYFYKYMTNRPQEEAVF